MIQKILFTTCVVLLAIGSMSAQTDQWTTVTFGKLQCDFPEAYSPIDFPGASGIFYEGGKVYLTVTTLADTSKMKGNLDRDYTKDFMLTVLEVSRKLKGKVREYRDTVIANMPGYISMMEVSFNDGRKSHYELIQLLDQDSMRNFSAQYFIDSPEAKETSRRFFRSIKATSGSSGRPGKVKLGIWAGLAFLVIGTFAFMKWKRK